MTLTHQEYCDIPQSVVQAAFEVAVSSTSTKNPRRSVPHVPVQTNVTSVTSPIVAPLQAQRFNNVDLDTPMHTHVTPNISFDIQISH